jgi:hypothetical protein
MHPGIADMDELAAAFAAAEDGNHGLFGYVSAVNTEVETLEDNIAKLRREIEAHGQAVRLL